MGNPEGIWIYAVFVSNTAGEILKENAQGVGGECCIISYIDETAWTVLVISFISVLAVISLLATIFFTVNHWRNHQETRTVIDDKMVDMLPSITFGSVNLIGHIGETCTICLEDYKHGENLKVLPCQHGKVLSYIDTLYIDIIGINWIGIFRFLAYVGLPVTYCILIYLITFPTPEQRSLHIRRSLPVQNLNSLQCHLIYNSYCIHLMNCAQRFLYISGLYLCQKITLLCCH